MNIYLDIETVPAQSQAVRDEIAAPIRAATHEEVDRLARQMEALAPPANYKDPAKIAEWNLTERPKKAAALQAEIDGALAGMLDSINAAWRKTALDGTTGQIVCLSMAFDQGDPINFSYASWETAEQHILREFFDEIDDAMVRNNMRPPTFVGHNLSAFDIRFIWQRAVVNGVRPSKCLPINAKPWGDEIFDTMTRWAGSGKTISLDRLCRALGIPGKPEDIDGSKVWDYVSSGQIAKVAEYCDGDVLRVREIHRRMTFNKT